MGTIKKITIAFLPLMLLSFIEVEGQSFDRLSINLNGGINRGHHSVEPGVNHVFGGGFEFGSEHFTFRLDYDTGFLASNENDDYGRNFENSFYKAGGGFNYYLGNALLIGSERINPYLSLKAGVMQSDVTPLNPETPYTRDYNELDQFVTVGGGLRLGLSQGIDFLGIVDLSYAFTDYLDGYHREDMPLGNDFFSTFRVGLGVNLGSFQLDQEDGPNEDPDIDEEMGDPDDLENNDAQIDEEPDQGDVQSREAADSDVNININLQEELNELEAFDHENLSQEIDALENEIAELREAIDQTPSERTETNDNDYQRDMQEGEVIQPQEGHYYVILGAFREVTRAELMLSSYKESGVDVMIVDNTDEGWYLVSADYYTSLDSAHDRLLSIKSGIEPEAWIFAPNS